MHHEVKVAKGKDGNFPTDANGMALFKKETQASACAAERATKWPLYLVSEAAGDTKGQGVREGWFLANP